LSRSPSGQRSTISSAISIMTGIVRRPRMIPPMPIVSAIV
jgi:hypothetical protein